MKEKINKIANEFSIRDLENLSGIKAHTIRIWESRYGIFQPDRSSTNIRKYGVEELKKVLNIATLNRSGLKISKITKLTDEEIMQQVDRQVVVTGGNGDYWVKLFNATLDYDEVEFCKIMDQISKSIGFEEGFISEIIPFFNKLGTAWQIGAINPSHEHFASNLIRQKIYSELQSVVPIVKQPGELLFILFLPMNEIHEIGLLFFSYIIKMLGVRSIYLGQSVPLEDLESFKQLKAKKVFVTSFTTQPVVSEIPKYVEELLSRTNEQDEIWITGKNSEILESHHRYQIVKDMTAMVELVKEKSYA